MKKYTGVIVAVIVIIIVGVYMTTRNAGQNRSFNLGVISILSGDYAAVGENVKNGVILAYETYNTAHPDAPVKVTIEDDAFNGGKGVSAYQKLTTVDNVDALINVSTPTIDAIYESVSKNPLPIIQIGEQGREPSDDAVFGIFPSSIISEYDYGVYMRNKGVKEMALVYTNMDAMIRFVESFKLGFQGSTTDFVINADEKDFRTHALKLAAAQPSQVGFFIFPQQGAQFIKEFAKVQKNKPALFFDANFQSGYTDYQRILGDLTVLDGALIGTVESVVSDDFKNAYKARFGSDAGFLADMGYDAFNLLVETHSDDPKKWMENIKSASYEGVGGNVSFDEAGNRKPKTKIMVVKDGALTDLP